MNKHGHLGSLVPSHPGNTNALRRGVYSPRSLAPRAREIADALLDAAHAVPLDQIAAEEIGSLVALVEAIDDELAERGLLGDDEEPRTLVELRVRVSGRLQRWLADFGATPSSRVAWIEKLVGSEDIVSALRRELATRRDDITPAPANKKDGIDRNPLADEGQGDGNT